MCVFGELKIATSLLVLKSSKKQVKFVIHRIHKWRTRRKKLVPSHESEALQDKQKLQMKTFSELAERLARIPPKTRSA